MTPRTFDRTARNHGVSSGCFELSNLIIEDAGMTRNFTGRESECRYAPTQSASTAMTGRSGEPLVLT